MQMLGTLWIGLPLIRALLEELVLRPGQDEQTTTDREDGIRHALRGRAWPLAGIIHISGIMLIDGSI